MAEQKTPAQTPASRARETGEWLAVRELEKSARDMRGTLEYVEYRAERAERGIRDRARWEARQWAESVLDDPASVVVSIATTGLSEPIDPVEAVVLSAAGETLLHERIRPEVEIEPEAQEIHGHTAETLADAPAFADVWPRLRKVLDGKRVVAYNAPWLRDVLAGAAERYGLEPPEARWECAMEAYTRTGGTWYVSREEYAPLALPGRGDTPTENASAALEVVRRLAREEDPGQPPPPRESSGGVPRREAEEDFDDIPFRAVFPARVRYPLIF